MYAGNDSDSDAENEKLLEIDEILREYDPQFGGNEGFEIGLSEAHQLHLAIERIRYAIFTDLISFS
jgi:actin-related protein 5